MPGGSPQEGPTDGSDDYAIIDPSTGAPLGMVLGLVLVVLLIGAVLWVAFAGTGDARGAMGGGRGGVPNNNNPPALIDPGTR